MLIYIVEDDFSIGKLMEYALESKNYDVKLFNTGEDFFKELEVVLPDIVLLDIMLPDMDGMKILKTLKSGNTSKIPVMMVTAKTTEFDVVNYLDMGADDYLKKPFSVLELLARVNSLLRRTKKDEIFEFEGINLNASTHIVTVDDKEVILSYKEFELLKALMENEERVLSREILLSNIWGYEYMGETRTVDIHIKTLREKLGEKREFIKTIRGIGYKLSRSLK